MAARQTEAGVPARLLVSRVSINPLLGAGKAKRPRRQGFRRCGGEET